MQRRSSRHHTSVAASPVWDLTRRQIVFLVQEKGITTIQAKPFDVEFLKTASKLMT